MKCELFQQNVIKTKMKWWNFYCNAFRRSVNEKRFFTNVPLEFVRSLYAQRDGRVQIYGKCNFGENLSKSLK